MKTVVITENNKDKFYGCTMTYGHFSVIHPGHIRYLSKAKKKGGKLVIALIGDKKKEDTLKYKYSQRERVDALKMLNIVDGIVLLKEDFLTSAIKLLKPSNLFLGNEFRLSDNEEIQNSLNFLKNNSGKVFFDAGDINYTSSYLLEELKDSVQNKRIESFKEALKRQNINKKNLLDSINQFNLGKTLVLGDTIIDQYIDSEPLGISAEAPVLVVREINKKNFIGGAAIVASHIKSLGSNCNYVSVVGIDKIKKFLESKLISQKINFNLIEDPSRPTTLKKRYIVENQKIFRVSKLENKFVQKEIEEKIINSINKNKNEINTIVISDFNYGVITKTILEEITLFANRNNITLIGDVQSSSQIGHVTKLKNFDLICANEKEVRISLNDHTSGIENLCNDLIKITSCKNLIIKLGSKGLILYKYNEKKEIISQPFPALNIHPIDTAGAGDSLLATMACGISGGVPIEIVTAISCFVTALSVERMGNIPITKDLLKNEVINLEI